MREYSIGFGDLKISAKDVYEVMGYDRGVSPDKEMRRQTEMLMGEAAKLTVPRFAYLITDGILTTECLTTETGSFQLGPIIGRQLKRSECFVFFVATSGVEFAEWMEQLKQKEDIVASYIADSLGTCIAEATADYLEGVLAKEVRVYGWSHTNRYSPGYCEWNIVEQKQLFTLFPNAPCGVQLTESSLMLPIKSVSGVIGVGSNVKRLAYTCGLCALDHCYRKAKETVGVKS